MAQFPYQFFNNFVARTPILSYRHFQKLFSQEEFDENKIKDQVEDQVGLSIGDTGKFDTVLGSYEMTLDGAKLVGEELEGEKSTRDGFVILDVTIKNTSEHSLLAEDLILSMEVADNLEHSGSTDHADGFDTVEHFDGDIQPGEEKSAQFLTIVDDEDTYYFRKMVGNIASGSSNQVIWTFNADEAR